MKQDLEVGDSERVLFENPNHNVSLDVRVADETIWLTQSQIAELFSVHANTVSEHLKNIFASDEVERANSMRRIRILRKEGARTVARTLNHYNLDAIISVGYRVSSSRGARFRRWATQVLRKKLEKDFRRRSSIAEQSLADVKSALGLARKTLSAQQMITPEAQAVVDIIDHYTRSFTLLLQYDEDRLPEAPTVPTTDMKSLSLAEARGAIVELKRSFNARGEDTALLGQERGDGLESILATIEQTVFGEAAYPSVESRAANLLYFIIKNHPFSDGNKRIGSFLFVRYLALNDRLHRADGSKLIEENALVALALLIAESDPAQRELVVRLVLGLLEEGGAEA